MTSMLTRLVLVSLIVFGGYKVFIEQQTLRVYENEVKSLEKSFETLLDSRSSTLDFRNLRRDVTFFSWLYHAPPNQSFTIQLLSKESGEVLSTTMLRIPGQATGHYGIIDLDFYRETETPLLIKRLDVFGPNFLKAEKLAGGDSQFVSPTFLGFPVSQKSDVFATFKGTQRRSWPFFSFDARAETTTRTCRPGIPLALCCYAEQETAGSPLMHREFVIQVSVDD